jgi:aspartyl-tRNA(Asn)/glutamyl-tRNA(Gln) amidotransferase subunit C
LKPKGRQALEKPKKLLFCTELGAPKTSQALGRDNTRTTESRTQSRALNFQLLRFLTMSLTLQEISRIGELAKLQMNANEQQSMLTQLNSFFDLVEQIKSVDTQGVVPLSHPYATVADVALRLRPDVVSEKNQREANQQSAPEVQKGLFLVPKVIES